MTETHAENEEEPEDESVRGITVMPNVPGFTQQFNQIAGKHKFRVANKAESKVRNLFSAAKTPLGESETESGSSEEQSTGS